MADKKLYEVVIVTELPTKGDNYHIYMLKGGTTQAPLYTLHSFVNGSWVEYVYNGKVVDILKALTDYSASATQTLKNVNGTLKWVTDSTD